MDFGGIGGLISASPLATIIGIHGQRETNAANVKEAALNRESMEYLSSTAHQREVKDLEAAGLNPILSANAGASTPSSSAAVQQNPMEQLAASARDAIQLGLQFKKQGSEIALLNAQTRKAQTEASVLSKDIPKSELTNDIYDLIRPGVKKMKDLLQNSAPKPSNDGIQKSDAMGKALQRIQDEAYRKYPSSRPKNLNRQIESNSYNMRNP